MARLWLTLLLLTASVAGAEPPARITADAFAAPPSATTARLSPDGTRIAAVGSGKGSDYIFIVNPDAPSKVLRRINIGKAGLGDLIWANDDRLILSLYNEFKFFGLAIRTAKILVVDIASGEVCRLDDKAQGFTANEVIHVDPGGKSALVSGAETKSNGASVKRIDLATGAITPVQDSVAGVSGWFADEQGVVRGGLARDGYRWSIYYRTKPGDPLTKFQGKFDKNDEEVFEAVYFSPLGGETVIVSNHATGRFAAYRLDLKTVEPGALIFENPHGDIDEVMRDPDSGRVVGIRYHDERWRTHFIDPDLARVQARLDKALPGADNLIINMSRNRDRFLIRSGRSDDPGVFYLLDGKKGAMKIIFAQYPDVPETSLSVTRQVSFKARDGLTIPAYLTLPRGRPDRSLPLILLPHGGPFARDTTDYDPWVQFFASRGYAVLQPQFRGTTGFGRQFVERGYGEWGRKMQDDLDDGLAWLVAQGTVDPKRVCIVGASYGGYAALWGAIRNPDKYRCAISWAGVTDLKTMLDYDRSLFAATRYYRHWRNHITGVNKKDNLVDFSPLRQARSLRVPVLVGHGRKDKNVPVSQSEELVKALGKAGIAVETAYYPELEHSFYGTGDFADWLKRNEAFLAKHNPADLPPGSARP